MKAEGLYYSRKIKKAALTETKTKKSPQVTLVFEVQFVSDDGEWIAVDPFEAYIHWSLAGGAQQYTMEKLERIGFNGDFGNPEFDFGDGVSLWCKHDDYNGKTKEKWDLSREGGGIEPVEDQDAIRRFNAIYKEKCSPKPKAATPPPTPEPAPAGAASADGNDIPF